MKLPYVLLTTISTALLLNVPSMAQVTKVEPKPRVQIQQPNKVSQPRTPPKDLNARPVIPGRIITNPIEFDSGNFPEPSQAMQHMHKVMKVCSYDTLLMNRVMKRNGKPSAGSGTTLYVSLKGSKRKNSPYEVLHNGSLPDAASQPLGTAGFFISDDKDDTFIDIGKGGSYIIQTVQRENWNYFKEHIDDGKGVCFGTRFVEKTDNDGTATDSATVQMWSGAGCVCRTR